ncbi:MAG: protein-glutamate O-methyltransferase CheR [Cycloclasticus sp.]|nr:protein-glutamate O-methyltransferase CheR [Cycloclasticus sp.]
MSITAQEFQNFKEFLKKRSGISLADNKQYLVSNRLRPLMKEVGIDNLSDLLSMIIALPNNELAVKAVDAMTTNETFWFRDTSHFHCLETKLFAELTQKSSSLSIWSAACSSGQEPYSISLSLDKYIKASGKRVNVRMTGTDLSDKILAKAKAGIYADIEVSRGLPNDLLKEHFAGVKDGLQISSTHRSRLSFRKLNLLDNFSSLGQFDIIFCRNVLLYFAGPTKLDILNRITNVMKPGGVLFLSSSEIAPSTVKGLETVRDAGCKFYRKT